MVSLGFSMQIIMSFAKSESFSFSFPIQIPFISFSPMIAVGRTSKTMLNNSGQSVHPCLITEFRGNALTLSPLRIRFSVGSLYVAFIILRYVSSQCQTLFWGAPKSLQMVTAAMKLKDTYSLEEKLRPTQIVYSKAETLLC